MKIGLYFGSFNPIHHGHLIIASYIVQETPAEQVWFVVSPQNPLKKSKTLLNEYHRLHLVRMSIEDEPSFRASDIEFRLPRPSYTIDTLTYLREKYPAHEFSLIMGSDSYQNFRSWKNYEQLLRDCPVLVYMRTGFDMQDHYEGARVTFLEAPLIEISSTHIRKNIAAGKSIRYLVPEKVMEEIMRNGYYRSQD